MIIKNSLLRDKGREGEVKAEILYACSAETKGAYCNRLAFECGGLSLEKDPTDKL